MNKNKKYDIKWCKKENYKDCYTYDDCYTDRCCKFVFHCPFLCLPFFFAPAIITRSVDDLSDSYDDKCESVKHGSKVDCYYYEKSGCHGNYLKAKGNYDELPKKWKHEISSWYCEEEDSRDDH